MKNAKLTLFIYLFVGCSALSAKTNDLFDLYAGVGNLSEFPSTVQTDDQGTTNSLFFTPTFHIGINYNVVGQFSLHPELILTLPIKGRDPLISKFKYFTLLSGAYSYDRFHFRLGAGFALQSISGDGGTQALANGLGTDDFPMPESASISRNFITLLGVEYFIIDEFSLRAEAFVYNIEADLNRAYSYNLSVMYHFGDLNFFDENPKKIRRKKRKRRKAKKTRE